MKKKIKIKLGYWPNSPKGPVYVVLALTGAVSVEVLRSVKRISDDCTEKEADELTRCAAYEVNVVPYTR